MFPLIYASDSDDYFMENYPNPDLDCDAALNRDTFCMYCGKKHADQDVSCGSCGKQRATQLDPDDTVMFCRSCGNVLPMFAKYCSCCGASMTRNTPPAL